MIADYHRRGGGKVRGLVRRDGLVPTLLAGGGKQRHYIVIGSFHVEPVAIHSNTAIADRATCLPYVVPNLLPGPRVNSKSIIRAR